MFTSFVGFLEFGFLFIVAFILVFASVVFAGNVIRRAFSSGVVQIASFPDLADTTKDRAAYLLARARELGRPVSLDALYEVKVPALTTRFGAKDDLKFLNDVKINIQGVDIPDVIRKLFAALPDTQPIVSASPEPAAAGSAARLEWEKPSGERVSWLLVSKLPASDANATKEIVDRAIYRLVFYIYYDPTGPRRPPMPVQFSSARALEAYYAGQQHLSAYQRERGDKATQELEQAEQQFRTLYREMPDFVDGLMLLGVTLSEERNDTEALIIFDRVVQLLAKAADKKVLFQAKLFHATALRKLYDWRNNHKALRELDGLKREIEPLLGSSDNGDRLDYLKIYISVLTEKAYALGVNLILLNEKNFIEVLTADDFITALAKDNDVKTPFQSSDLEKINAELAQRSGDRLNQAKQRHTEAFRYEMEWIYRLHQKAAQEAKTSIDKIAANGSEGKRARERFLSDLYNAEAYALYRRAQALEDDDTKFREKCEIARAKLHEAYAVHQNEYTILLNLGLVYGDPRCDSENKYIEFARGFFSQSVELKPSDYYGHQQLATLAIRGAYAWGLELTETKIIDEAVTHAERARQLRPGEGTIFALLAQAYALQWAKASDDNSRKALEPKIEASLAQAARYRATPIHQATAWAQWLVQRSRRSTDDEFKNTLKPRLAAALDRAIEVATGDRSWYGRQLLKDATTLKKTLLQLEDGKQSTLRWPN